MPGVCDSYIPQNKLPFVEAQQTNVWCWAAAAQVIFKYYGYDVSQATIVNRGYGTTNPPITTGAPIAMLRTMNTTYVDNNGNKFTVRTKKHHDKYSWLVGDPWTASLQTGVTLAEIHAELDNERPVFYGSQTHAMVLVGSRHFNQNPMVGWVLDPAPAYPQFLPPGPITMPGVQSIGLRPLSQPEMQAYFIALVEVTPN
jgi:hypothetical protein